MVITNSFEIFANKYHNNQHLPNDIINIIMNINTKEIKKEKQLYHIIKYKKLNDEIKNIYRGSAFESAHITKKIALRILKLKASTTQVSSDFIYGGYGSAPRRSQKTEYIEKIEERCNLKNYIYEKFTINPNYYRYYTTYNTPNIYTWMIFIKILDFNDYNFN